jgi:hypothetical protein
MSDSLGPKLFESLYGTNPDMVKRFAVAANPSHGCSTQTLRDAHRTAR